MSFQRKQIGYLQELIIHFICFLLLLLIFFSFSIVVITTKSIKPIQINLSMM